MAKHSLVIVESPAKAKTIGKYLGPDYQVKASMGHLRDLPKSKLGIDIEPEELVSELRMGQKQLLEIAKALLFDAKLLILDEPTTALNNEEIDHLFGILRTLRRTGKSFIFISHKMPEIFALCDRYTVLRNGEFIAQGSIADTDARALTSGSHM